MKLYKHTFSIMVNVVTSHNWEVMPLCVRSVGKEKNIREFIQFSTSTSVSGQATAAQVYSDLRDHNIDLKKSGVKIVMEPRTCPANRLMYNH